MFSEYRNASVGKAIRPQRPSLKADWTCAEAGSGRTGRRSVSPSAVRDAELMASKRRSGSVGVHSPPPYGVGGCSPAQRTTGRRQTTISGQINKTPLKLTDMPVGSVERAALSPGRVMSLRQIAPRDCMKHLSEPPADFRMKVQCRSRSCPPQPSGEIVHKQKGVSPNKMTSKITAEGGVMAGEGLPKRASKGGVQMGANSLNFVVSRQQHAPQAARSRSASFSSVSPVREGLPMYIAKKRFGGGVFAGQGTASAMCWNKPAEYTFAKKRLQHQHSENVNLVLTGRSQPEPIRGRRGQSQTFCSHVVTNADMLPDTYHHTTRAQRPNSTYSHTRLW